MPRPSRITSASREEVLAAVNGSTSLKEVLLKLTGSVGGGGSYNTLHQRLQAEGIDSKALAAQGRKVTGDRGQFPLCDVLVENSSYNRCHLKRRLLQAGLLEDKCYLCGLGPEWQGKPLVMVIDHINGVSNDNRISNLRIVCPNCNAQLPTFSGRNAGKPLRGSA